MNLFGRKKEDIAVSGEVELNIIVYIREKYVNSTYRVSINGNTGADDFVRAAFVQGKIEKNLYKHIRGIKPPLMLMINGSNISRKEKKSLVLNDGDVMTIMSPASGG